MNHNNQKLRSIAFIILVLLLITLLIVGYILMSKYNKKEANQIETKNEVVYDNYIYKLPSICKYQDDYKENGVEKLKIYNIDALWSATIVVVDVGDLEGKDKIFEDSNILKQALEKVGNDVREGEISQYGDVSVISFHLYHEEKEYLLAYIPAYDGYYYSIRISSSRFVDGEEELYFDYDTLEYVIDILKTGKKVK